MSIHNQYFGDTGRDGVWSCFIKAFNYKSKKEGKDQELIQSTTTPSSSSFIFLDKISSSLLFFLKIQSLWKACNG